MYSSDTALWFAVHIQFARLCRAPPHPSHSSVRLDRPVVFTSHDAGTDDAPLDQVRRYPRIRRGRHVALAFLVFLSVSAVAVCGKDSSTTPAEPTPPPPPAPPQPVPAKPTTIDIAPAAPDTLTAVGQTLQLTATVTDEDGHTVTGVNVVWESRHGPVARVDDTGLVTAVGNGTAKISARVGRLEAIPVSVTVSLSADREVLTLFYHLTDGPNWTNGANWLSEEPLREWYGVETRNTGRVVELRLDENNLSGVIPADLARLTGLRTLGLRNNGALSGALPGELIDLQLGTLRLGGTGVCAPPDAAIQAWLRSIPDRRVGDCFTVDPDQSAAYLVQATQSFSHPVPLVAGERALLRVFPVAGTDDVETAMPPIRATFYLDDAEVHVVDVPGGDAIVPARIDEGSLATSVNREIPGNVIQPGLEMVVEIGPDSTATSDSGAGVRLPETGRMAVDVKDVPPRDLTLVPFLWEENPDRSVLTELEGATADSWRFRAISNMLPVREFRLTVREHVLTQVEPVYANAGDLLGVITMIRAADGASGHYMGILMSEGGVANRPGFVSLAKFIPNVMTHELGHNMNLGHAPCNVGDPGPVPRASWNWTETAISMAISTAISMAISTAVAPPLAPPLSCWTESPETSGVI